MDVYNWGNPYVAFRSLKIIDMLDFIIDFITELVINKISRKTWIYILIGIGLFIAIRLIFVN